MKIAAKLLALVALAGCATLAKQAFKEPYVELRDVRIIGFGISGGEIEVSLGVRNPNNYRIDANHLNYRLFISDTVQLASGQLDTRSTVQASDSTLIRIPVAFTYAGVGLAGRQLLNTGVVNYKVTGAFTVESAFGNFDVPFSTTGRYSTTRR